MKIIIAGSRQIEDQEALNKTVEDANWDITEVVSGACRGVDCMGENWAKLSDIPVRPFHAEWARHGRGAGELRNRDMAEYADGLILLWDGKSPGASCMLREATKAGIKIHSQIYGMDMSDLEATEQAILDHYRTKSGRLVCLQGHWGWEVADASAPDINPHAVAELIQRGAMAEDYVKVLKLA